MASGVGMALLSLIRTTSVTPQRNTVDNGFDEDDWVSVGDPVKVKYFLDPPVATITEKGKSYTQNGRLYALRNVDIQDNDRIPLPEGVFGIVGPAGLNQDHSITGSDFGWKKYVIRLGG